MNPFSLDTLPAPLEWQTAPLAYDTDNADTLQITAGAQTDWFFDPANAMRKNDAPVCLFTPPARPFTLHARVKVEFVSRFDAGVLFVYGDAAHWAKLCFEYSPQGQPMVVSVVTRDVSDDCNAVTLPDNAVFLRAYADDKICAFHYSLDGAYWHLVRYFALGVSENVRVGFSAQAPTGNGCRVEFSQIVFAARALADLRSGQ